MRAAEDIVLSLDSIREDEEKVLYQHPSGEALRYYLRKHHLDPAPVQRVFRQHEHILLIVNEEYNQTARTVLAENGLDSDHYSDPVPVQTPFNQATLYRMHRTDE